MKSLSLKQRRFVEEYLVDNNATKAYLRAGYNVSENVARAAAARLLALVSIQSAIQSRVGEQLRKLEMSANEVVEALSMIARGSIADFLRIDKESGTVIIDLSQATRGQLKAVAEYSVEEVFGRESGEVVRIRRTRIKLHDELRALKMLGQHLGMFSDRGLRPSKKAVEILRQVRNKMLSVEDACYGFALLGEPLPDILKIMLVTSKCYQAETGKPWTTEEIEARAREMQEGVKRQIEQFLPARREEVAALKDKIQNNSAFTSADFSGDD